MEIEIAVDLCAGLAASACASPLIATVDRAVTELQSGASKSIITSARSSLAEIATAPIAYARSPVFLWMLGVYGLTYTTANICDSVISRQQKQTSDSVMSETDSEAPPSVADSAATSAVAKLMAITAVNMTATIAKDRAYARMFGTVLPRGVPAATYGLWLARDLASMGCAFTLPPIVSATTQNYAGTSTRFADTAAQIACPIALQFFSTPVHLLGLDIYNKPDKSSFGSRINGIRPNYFPATFIRMARHTASYGIGANFNREIRNGLRARFVTT